MSLYHQEERIDLSWGLLAWRTDFQLLYSRSTFHRVRLFCLGFWAIVTSLIRFTGERERRVGKIITDHNSGS